MTRPTILTLRKLFCNHTLIKFHRVFFDYIYQYSTASTRDAAYIIGGAPRYSETIARFQDYEWSKHGKLNRGRMVHGSINVGETVLVVGGETSGLE